MKKVLNTLFVVFTFFIFTFSVSAKENKWIEYDWSIKQGKSFNYLYYDFTIEDTNGYVTTSVDENAYGVLRKISKDGKNILWEQKSDRSLFLTLSQDNNFYYTVDYALNASNYQEIYFCRHDKKTGKLDDCIFLDDPSKEIYDADIYVHEDVIYVSAVGVLSDGNYGTSRFYTIRSSKANFRLEKSENYEDVKKDTINEDTYNRNPYLNKSWYEIYPDKTESIDISNEYVSGDSYYVIGDCKKNGKTRGFIMKADMNQNVQWVKKGEEGYHFFDISSPYSTYVAVAAYKDDKPLEYGRNPESVESYIYVYDEFGELVETHDIAKEIGVKRADITSIFYQKDALLVQAFAYDDNGVFSSYLVRYLTSNSIYTDIKGEGKVEVDDKAKPGDEVTFTVTPGDGYVIKEILVIDENGNTIDTKNNKFIMPDCDVTIKVTFVKDLIENPETGVSSYMISGAILLLSAVVLYVLTRRYNKLAKLR